ncbi:MAG: hypothetical protein ACLFU2_01100 [Opitutales bacterium]
MTIAFPSPLLRRWLFAAALVLLAQSSLGQKKTLAIGTIQVSPAVSEHAGAENTRLSLERLTDALAGQLSSAFQATGKLDLLARSDAAALFEEEAFSGQTVQLAGADFLLVVTVDDFQDFSETAYFPALDQSATKRVVRFSAVGNLYDAQTTRLLESANFQISNRDARPEHRDSVANGRLSDALLLALTREMAEEIAVHLTDVIYPARVVARTGPQVTINRGEGSGIAVGQVWDVLAEGEDLIDPDTGASLGRNVFPVGQVRIVRVLPRLSLGEVMEDLGIATGALLQPVSPVEP